MQTKVSVTTPNACTIIAAIAIKTLAVPANVLFAQDFDELVQIIHCREAFLLCSSYITRMLQDCDNTVHTPLSSHVLLIMWVKECMLHHMDQNAYCITWAKDIWQAYTPQKGSVLSLM